MTTGQDTPKRWSSWTIEIKVWKILAALIILPILVLWFRVVHQNDEILALVRNEVVTDAAGQRTWAGSFVNTNDRTLRDVAVTVDFLDNQDRTVGKAEAEAAELPFNTRLDLQAPLPRDAVRLRIYSVQWRMGRTAALMGPFREPWEFGYLMVDPAKIDRQCKVPVAELNRQAALQPSRDVEPSEPRELTRLATFSNDLAITIAEGYELDLLVNSVWGGYENMVEDGRFTWLDPYWQQLVVDGAVPHWRQAQELKC